MNEAPPKQIEIPSLEPVKIDRRTRKGKKQAIVSNDIKPSYLSRKTPLEYSTIEEYMTKANIIHKTFKNEGLSPKLKGELHKLLNDNPNIDENMIKNEMDYLNDIDNTIQRLRAIYKNDNSF